MKTKISLLLLAILCNFSVFAQSDFDKYFEKKSLRVDFALSGNLKSQSAAIQGLREEPVWGGPVKNLIDKFNYGGYYINVYDKATNKLIYSRGFNTLFEEWRSTEQAKTETQSWTNSASVPFPKVPIYVEITARDKADMQFHPLLRPDDATTFQFLVPSNFFAVTSLRKSAEILRKVNHNEKLAKECSDLAQEVETALQKYAVYNHPKYGKIYAFEVDGFGNQLLMDDANVPSLLAMPYLGDVDINDPIYQNTRKFVWSEDNPYFFKGSAGEGIGGPHIGYDMVWPMSIMMKAFTSQNDQEIKECIEMLMKTDAGTGFMHESFHKNDPKNFTRAWFAWQNTLFGELILKLVNEGKVDLLNSIDIQ